jgi:hypothetical protein
MKLYHGSNTIIEKPRLIESLRGLDFGSGFYTTTNYDQAVRFTENVIQRKKTGKKTVSVYEINEELIQHSCTILSFTEPDADWLNFVVKNRTQSYIGPEYDIVSGPVANDTVFNTIDLYINGILNESETIQRLKIRKLYDQWTFRTQKSIDLLIYKEAVIL